MTSDKSENAPGHTKTYSIIVNGRPREVSDHKLTYLQVVQLAYPGERRPTTVLHRHVLPPNGPRRHAYRRPGGHDQGRDDLQCRKTDKS